ncbi:hypothetical protein QTG54_002390 [Skeletonema marinoi]|uniref:RING-type domain-containing protein n=1 Tax=Skeletonema marinoi TaxID=267567 RepID=A0AAD8YL15_9STRA|nr:hypothetical protein QTG54_002390 [Skeletonema marinoi]
MTSTTATNIPPPLEATPAPYYSYWGDPGETPGVDVPTEEATAENTNDDSPMQCDTCTDIDDEEAKKYECAVCFEFMDTPVGCGSCQTRFCRPCLERVANQGGARPKCSHCRAPFTLESIQVDEALQEEMNNCMETVLCPFRGCGKRVPINAIKLHEAQCDHIKMKCKFNEWGCEWIGKKLDLEHHDNHECEFRNEMGRLVNTIREKTLNQTETIARLQGTRVNQMVNTHTRQLLMIRGRNAGNVFDVLAMSYEATCFPGRLAAAKEMWGNMIAHDHPRALVYNVLLVLPLFVCISKCSFWMAIDLSNMAPQHIYRVGLYGMIQHFHVNIVASSAAGLAVFCMVADGGDATHWTEMHVQGTGISYPFMRDIVALGFYVCYFLFVDFMEYWPGIVLLLCTFSFTVTYSSCVASILEKVNGSEEGTLKKTRMWPSVVFALRYTCLFQICWVPFEAVKGVIVLRLVKHLSLKHFKLNFTVEETECFLSVIPPSILVVFGAAVTALDHVAIGNGVVKDWSAAFYAWGTGAATLAFLNVFTHTLFLCGQGTGDAIYFEGTNLRNHSNERLQTYNLLPSQRPVYTGVVTFALALFYMIFMVAV